MPKPVLELPCKQRPAADILLILRAYKSSWSISIVHLSKALPDALNVSAAPSIAIRVHKIGQSVQFSIFKAPVAAVPVLRGKLAEPIRLPVDYFSWIFDINHCFAIEGIDHLDGVVGNPPHREKRRVIQVNIRLFFRLLLRWFMLLSLEVIEKLLSLLLHCLSKFFFSSDAQLQHI